MIFNKVFKGIKKDQKKQEEEQRIRIESIMAEAGEVLKRRGVTTFEFNDMLLTWLQINTAQLVKMLTDRDDVIVKLREDLKQAEQRINQLVNQNNDSKQSNEGKK